MKELLALVAVGLFAVLGWFLGVLLIVGFYVVLIGGLIGGVIVAARFVVQLFS